MSGKVFNLRSVRKARARSDKRARGDENAAKHGRSKANRDADKRIAERLDRHLDGHRKDDAE